MLLIKTVQSQFKYRSRSYWYRVLQVVLNAAWCIPTILIVRALFPLVQVRFGLINSRRIGHFVTDGFTRVILEKSGDLPGINLFWFARPCNHQISLMIRRELKVRWWVFPLLAWNRIIPGGQRHEIPSSLDKSRDIRGVLSRTTSLIPFTESELSQGAAWLASRGWNPDEPFVCLLVRDSKYLNEIRALEMTSDDWSYHSYRDSRIEDFVPTIQWLCDQGVWVLRMGRAMNDPVPLLHRRFIDYAFDPLQSDLQDVWLGAHCYACISTSAGFDSIPEAYERPVLYVNAMPPYNLHSYSNSTWYPKRLKWLETGGELTTSEMFLHSYDRTDKYTDAGIGLESLRPAEILEATQEFWQFIGGPNERSSEQDRFWEWMKKDPRWSNFHDWIHPSSRFAPRWLQGSAAARLH